MWRSYLVLIFTIVGISHFHNYVTAKNAFRQHFNIYLLKMPLGSIYSRTSRCLILFEQYKTQYQSIELDYMLLTSTLATNQFMFSPPTLSFCLLHLPHLKDHKHIICYILALIYFQSTFFSKFKRDRYTRPDNSMLTKSFHQLLTPCEIRCSQTLIALQQEINK